MSYKNLVSDADLRGQFFYWVNLKLFEEKLVV